MDYETILTSLKEFNRDEEIFKDFYLNPSISPEEFRAKYPEDKEDVDTALYPDKIPYFRSEDDLIEGGRNIKIIKHTRYFPLFYHEHAFFEIIYVLSGTCIQRFQGSTIKLKKGGLCLMAPNVEHGIEVFDESVILNLLIKRSTFMDIFINAVRDKTQLSSFFLDNIYSKKKMKYLIYHTNEDEKIRNYILDIYIEQQNFDEYSDRIMCSMLMIFFAQLTRRHKHTMDIPQSQNPLFEKEILGYMLNNYKSVTLSRLAEKLHFSVPYCSKMIKEASGYSFSELLTRIRLQKGENLLLSTQMSVAEISNKLGYENPETFIRVMKRYHGMTPSQYRKQ